MKKFLHLLASNNLLWKYIWLPLAKVARHMTWQRSDMEMKRLSRSLGPDYVVAAGPFKGMRYPRFEAVGSSIIGKVLGTYEVEINAWVQKLIATPYEVIVDIGCAEGYYAVGLAMKIPGCTVYAFDTDERARALCSEMAKLNGVADRVHVRGLCTPEELATLVAGKRALVISDCEAGELQVFTPGLIPSLAACDVLIEAHDFIVPGITETMQHRFSSSHTCAAAHSLPPLDRMKLYQSPLIKETDPEVLTWLYNEGRPESMEWLLFTPRN